MSAARIWTDVALRPAARAILTREQAVLIEALDESPSLPADTEGVIAGSRLLADAAFFRSAPQLRVLARVGMGFERINLDAATAAGVCVVNTPAAPTESTAEFAILLMLALSRRLVVGAASLAARRWTQGTELEGGDLAGRTLGLVGCGRIGRRVAEIARALGMRIVAFDPVATELPAGIERAASLPALLAGADIVSLHAPLNNSTKRLLGANEFSQMKRAAVLINTSRGGLIDEHALHAALQDGQLAGAALDVWDPEPPSMDNPLLQHPRVLATPHMAAYTEEGRDRSHTAAAAQVLQTLRGEKPPHLLNPAAWPAARGAGSSRIGH